MVTILVYKLNHFQNYTRDCLEYMFKESKIFLYINH